MARMEHGHLSISLQEATGFSPWSFIFLHLKKSGHFYFSKIRGGAIYQNYDCPLYLKLSLFIYFLHLF
jgi:hypothetical protein